MPGLGQGPGDPEVLYDDIILDSGLDLPRTRYGVQNDGEMVFLSDKKGLVKRIFI